MAPHGKKSPSSPSKKQACKKKKTPVNDGPKASTRVHKPSEKKQAVQQDQDDGDMEADADKEMDIYIVFRPEISGGAWNIHSILERSAIAYMKERKRGVGKSKWSREGEKILV
ncbi:hypothetical protein HWV62_17668 [Athelia sp. TMB]|nr:hypothetical protein HWV62_17668 [Athelia sp. TMB]